MLLMLTQPHTKSPPFSAVVLTNTAASAIDPSSILELYCHVSGKRIQCRVEMLTATGDASASDRRREALRYLQNREEFELVAGAFDDQVPLFLCPQPGSVVVTIRVIAERLIDTFGSYPDFCAGVAVADHFERSLRQKWNTISTIDTLAKELFDEFRSELIPPSVPLCAQLYTISDTYDVAFSVDASRPELLHMSVVLPYRKKLSVTKGITLKRQLTVTLDGKRHDFYADIAVIDNVEP